MNNNKISNPQKQTPTGITMNDKDYTNSLLTCLKEMTKNYTIAMTEASNESLYNSFHSIFKEITNLQRETYELMFRKGWYSLEPAVTSEAKKFSPTPTPKIKGLASRTA